MNDENGYSYTNPKVDLDKLAEAMWAHKHHKNVDELNIEDAKKLGVVSGDKVKVSSRRGEIVTEAKVTHRVRPGLIFIPFHFKEAAANVLTNPALDPTAKIPELKVCAAKVEKA